MYLKKGLHRVLGCEAAICDPGNWILMLYLKDKACSSTEMSAANIKHTCPSLSLDMVRWPLVALFPVFFKGAFKGQDCWDRPPITGSSIARYQLQGLFEAFINV